MAKKISKIRVSEVDYDLTKTYKISNATSLENLDITNDLIYITLSGPTAFSLNGTMTIGQKLELIIESTTDFIQDFTLTGAISSFKYIKFKANKTNKIIITCYESNKYTLENYGGEEFIWGFIIHISKTISDPANMVTVDGLDSELLLSKFRRCLCKKVSDNNVKICFLNDNNSNQYHDGTTAKTDGTEGDVMVYFPEFWYLGTDTDDEWVMNISMEEKAGYNHAPASLVGAYKAIASDAGNNTNGGLYSKSNANSSANISMANFSTKARNRGAGYHLIDYQQHCIIAWMFYARYKNTNSQAICGTGEDAYSSINCGVTNSLGINDTTAESASSTSNMLVNFLGLEGCWGYKFECIEGIHSYAGDGVIAYDKGDYHDQPFSSVQSPTKRILRSLAETELREGYINKIEGGRYMDMLPAETNGAPSTYFCDYGYANPKYAYVYVRSDRTADAGGGVAYLGGGAPAATYIHPFRGSRLAFDGNIEVIDNVNTFKSLSVL